MTTIEVSRAEMREQLCTAIEESTLCFTKRIIDRPHLFYAALDHAMDTGARADRTYYVYEFAIIEKIVKAARSGNVVASRAWYAEIANARKRAASTVGAPNMLDVLLYPARALTEFADGDPSETCRMLDEADRCLTTYLDEGGGDADVAILEQRLNRFRVHLNFGPVDTIADLIVEFVRDATGCSCGSSRSSDKSVGNSEEQLNVELCYVDAVLSRSITGLDAGIVIDVLRRLADREGQAGQTNPVYSIARLCLALIDAGSCPRFYSPVVDAASLARAPSTLMTILDVLTREGKTPRDDALTRALATYTDRGRVGEAVGRWPRQLTAPYA